MLPPRKKKRKKKEKILNCCALFIKFFFYLFWYDLFSMTVCYFLRQKKRCYEYYNKSLTLRLATEACKAAFTLSSASETGRFTKSAGQLLPRSHWITCPSSFSPAPSLLLVQIYFVGTFTGEGIMKFINVVQFK